MGLSDFQRAVIDLEGSWWQSGSSKEQVIRDRLGVSPSHYYKTLRAVVDSGLADDYGPLVVRRIRMARARRLAERLAGSTAGGAGRTPDRP